MSAMVSVMLIATSPRALPRRLPDSRDLAAMGHVPETDAADHELAVIGTRPAAQTAAVPVPCLVLRLAVALVDLGDAGQRRPPRKSSSCGTACRRAGAVPAIPRES